MKKNTKSTLIYILSVVFLALVAAGLRLYACLTELDFATGYFESNLVSGISAGVAVAAALLAFSYLFFGKRHTPAPVAVKASSFIPAGAMAAVLLFLSVEIFVGTLGGDELGLSEIFKLVLAALALISTFAFFFSVFYEKRENTRKAAYSIAVSLFFAAYAAHLYFNTPLPINAPAKITDQMAFLFSAVFFLYETRISLGRSLWRAHTAFGMLAAVLAIYSAIPTLIALIPKSSLISDSLAATVLLAVTAVYAIIRVATFALSDEDKICEAARAIEALAEKREAELKEGLPHEGYSSKLPAGEVIGENYKMQIPAEENGTADAPQEESAGEEREDV